MDLRPSTDDDDQTLHEPTYLRRFLRCKAAAWKRCTLPSSRISFSAIEPCSWTPGWKYLTTRDSVHKLTRGQHLDPRVPRLPPITKLRSYINIWCMAAPGFFSWHKSPTVNMAPKSAVKDSKVRHSFLISIYDKNPPSCNQCPSPRIAFSTPAVFLGSFSSDSTTTVRGPRTIGMRQFHDIKANLS